MGGNNKLHFDRMVLHKWWRAKREGRGEKVQKITDEQFIHYERALLAEMEKRGLTIHEYDDDLERIAKGGSGAVAPDYDSELTLGVVHASSLGPDLAELISETEGAFESLAALVHDSWVSWSKELADEEDLSEDRLKRWEKLWVPYAELTEEQKEDDRYWAKMIMASLKEMGAFQVDKMASLVGRVGKSIEPAATFTLVRNVDVSGVSGIGPVLQGVMWADGTVAVRWRGETPSTAVYDSFKEFKAIHVDAHPENKSEIIWHSDPIVVEKDAVTSTTQGVHQPSYTPDKPTSVHYPGVQEKGAYVGFPEIKPRTGGGTVWEDVEDVEEEDLKKAEKTEVTILPDGSGFFVAEVPTKEERDAAIRGPETEEIEEELEEGEVETEKVGSKMKELMDAAGVNFTYGEDQVREVAGKLGVGDSEFWAFLVGMNVETEHGDSLADSDVDDVLLTIGRIALDHLVEDPDYYTKLLVMEAFNDVENRALEKWSPKAREAALEARRRKKKPAEPEKPEKPEAGEGPSDSKPLVGSTLEDMLEEVRSSEASDHEEELIERFDSIYTEGGGGPTVTVIGNVVGELFGIGSPRTMPEEWPDDYKDWWHEAERDWNSNAGKRALLRQYLREQKNYTPGSTVTVYRGVYGDFAAHIRNLRDKDGDVEFPMGTLSSYSESAEGALPFTRSSAEEYDEPYSGVVVRVEVPAERMFARPYGEGSYRGESEILVLGPSVSVQAGDILDGEDYDEGASFASESDEQKFVQHTPRVSAYSPPQVADDPVFKDFFREGEMKEEEEPEGETEEEMDEAVEEASEDAERSSADEDEPEEEDLRPAK